MSSHWWFPRSELNQNITNIPAVQEDLADIVSTTAELSNTQAAQVISYRAEQHAVLELADFLTFFNDSWSFVIKCETICRRMIVGLRGTVVGQVRFHVCFPFQMTLNEIRLKRRNFSFKPSTKHEYPNLQNLLKTSCGIPQRSHLDYNILPMC